MPFGKAKKLALDIEALTQENARLSEMLLPEQQNIVKLQAQETELQTQISEHEQKTSQLREEIDSQESRLRELREQLVVADENLLMETFALYKPTFDFVNSDIYNEKLKAIRENQKELIKADKACTGNSNWTVNGNAQKGKKMVKDMQKLLLRAFNNECDEAVSKVKYNNFEQSLNRIVKSREQIEKLGAMMGISITSAYFNSKTEELRLALEYRQKKQDEKEELKLLKEQQREEEKLRKEIEEQRRKVEKEQNHYQNALKEIEARILSAAESERAELLEKKREIEIGIAETEKAMKDIDYREANQRAGYVYIISNIGAFGENVYKIGMTRRLDPTERIEELGSASVPFNFDIHAMIFTEDAPALESALHRAFDDRKLNWVNTRREFFKVTLDEIKEVVKANHDKTAEFIEIAEAEQYRTSEKMKHQAEAQ